MKNKDRKFNVDPFGFDEIESGLFMGNLENNKIVIDFDLRAVAKYARDHNLKEIPEEVKEMFRKK